MGFRLTIVEGKSAGRDFYFSQPRVRVGRSPENDLVLYDMGVSRAHIEILTDGDAATLRDTGSANGTLLNGTVTTEAQIKTGDRIQLGPVVFRFEAAKSPDEPSGLHELARGEAFRPSDEGERLALEKGETNAFRPSLHPPLIREPSVNAQPPPDPALTEGRTLTGSFVAHSRQRWLSFKQLSPSTRVSAVLAVLLVLGGAAASVALWLRRPPPDRSAEIFAVDRTNAGLAFGAGKVDVLAADRVNFRFDYAGGRVTLLYTAGGIETETEVEILLNNKHVAHVPQSPGSWTAGLKLALPRALLRPGVNIVTFDNTLTPATDERWGVAQVRLQQEPLPAPDLEKAQELFDLGRASFEARSVSPPNLYRSIEYFAEATLYLEALETQPPLLASIRGQENAARVELQKVFDQYLFATEKALRFGDRDNAVESLRELLRFLPDPEDPRHKKAKDRLTELIGKSSP
jgi:hypothetical protein